MEIFKYQGMADVCYQAEEFIDRGRPLDCLNFGFGLGEGFHETCSSFLLLTSGNPFVERLGPTHSNEHIIIPIDHVNIVRVGLLITHTVDLP
jgi:hypothetical protein